MTKWLKKHFIPHEGNGHRPHILHRKNAAQLVGVVLLFELALFVLPGFNFVGFIESLNLGAVLPGVLSALTNEKRLAENLPQLSENLVLTKAAQMKAEDMASKSYFAHTSPEGKTPWYWLEAAGYSYVYAGENLAVNFIDSEDVTEAWMNSPTHRANIVSGAYTEIGTGIAAGVYKGRETVFVAQVFGRPAAINIQPTINNRQPIPNNQITNSNIQTTNATNVLGESAPTPKTAGIKQAAQETIKDFFQTAAASPRRTTDAVLYSVMGIIALALLFNIFVKIRHQHPDLILNGAVVMVVLLGLHISNSYISKDYGLETSFLAYNASEVRE